MKNYIFILCLMTVLYGCVNIAGGGRFYRSTSDVIVVCDKDHPMKYEYINDTSVGSPLGVSRFLKNDTLICEAMLYYSGNRSAYFYQFNDSGGSYYLKYPDVLSLRMHGAKYGSNTVVVTKGAENAAWAYTLKYIKDQSSMKIEIQTDLYISTHNPLSYGQRGFTALKYYIGQEVVIEINALVYGWSDLDLKAESNIAAYHITEFLIEHGINSN